MYAPVGEAAPELLAQHSVGRAEHEIHERRRGVDDAEALDLRGHGLGEERLVDLQHHIEAGVGVGGAGQPVRDAAVEAVEVAGLVAQPDVPALELVEQLVESLGDGIAVGEPAPGEQGVEHRHRHHVLRQHRDERRPGQVLADRGAHGVEEPTERLGKHLVGVEGDADPRDDPLGDRCDLAAPAVPVLAVAAHLYQLRGDGVLEREPALHRVAPRGPGRARLAAVAVRPCAPVAETGCDDPQRHGAAEVRRVDRHVKALVVGPERLQDVPHLLEIGP